MYTYVHHSLGVSLLLVSLASSLQATGLDGAPERGASRSRETRRTNPRNLKVQLAPVGFSAKVEDANEARPDDPPGFLSEGHRIVFLGDSNTYAGHYIAYVEAVLRLRGKSPEILNLGLPSETACGLSEPDHPFPRPNVHERLQRALDKTKPDVVVASYGMNDGIYYPFSEERFAEYRKGMEKLVLAARAARARVVLLTPPPFDPLPMRQQNKLRPENSEKFAWFAIYENYDDVMQRYTRWIESQRSTVDQVIDIRTPILNYVAQRRTQAPDFALSNDGVHIDERGHKIVAETILKAWNIDPLPAPQDGYLKIVSKRQTILRDAWLSHVGHVRPGVQPGLPLPEARKAAAELGTELLKSTPLGTGEASSTHQP